MSDAEGLMWRLEADPTFASSFATVTLLDQPADMERLRRRMSRAVVLVPRLRQRVLDRPLGLAPVWVDVAEVDIDHHVRNVTLPAPGTLRQLLDMATELLVQPFDRERPLWEFVAVDGLADGQGAVIQKMHHTITDGENGIKLSLQFLDLERHGAEPPPLTAEERDASAPQPAPTSADALLEAVGNGVRLSTGAATQITELMLDPARLLEVGGTVRDRVRGTVSTLSDTEKAHSTLWGARSLDRHVEILQVPLEPVKAAAHALGGTLNVAFLTASAAAAGAYHRELGAPVDTLRASMAISTRRKESSAGSNSFTLAKLRVPTSEMDVTERFAAIQAAADSGPFVGCGRHQPRLVGRAGGRAAHVAHRAPGAPAVRDDRLRHVQPARRAVPALHRRRPHHGQLPGRPAGRGGLQPHAAQLLRQPRHGTAPRSRRGRRACAAAHPAARRLRRADRRRQPHTGAAASHDLRPVDQQTTAKTPAKRRAKTATKGASKSRVKGGAKGAAKQPAKAKRGKKAPAKSRARAEAS